MPRDYGWVVGPDGVPQLVAGAGSRPSYGRSTEYSGADRYVPAALPSTTPSTAPTASPGGTTSDSGSDDSGTPVSQPYTGEGFASGILGDTFSGFTPTQYGDVTYGPITSGILGDRELTEAQRRRADASINTGIDALTGLPFGITSTLVNPQIRSTPWGSDFNVGGGGLAGIGGRLSLRNLTNIHNAALAERAPTGETNQDYLNEAFGGGTVDLSTPGHANTFYAPGTIESPGFGGQTHVTTPIATSPALGGVLGDDWQVLSGNTDLALQQNPHLDTNRDGQLTATEVNDYQAAVREREAAAARQAELDRVAEQDRALAEAARQREAELAAQRQAEESRRQQQAREAAERAEQERRNREAAAAELAASNRQRESEGRAQQQGSPVTDRHGNAVRDSSGGIVTDRPTDHSGGDSNGGGGGGGRVICNELRRQGYFTKDDIITEYKYTREHLTPEHVNGYHKFAIPMVKLMRKGKLVKFWHHIARHRLNAIRFKTGETDKRDVLGSIYGTVLEGVSWTLGQFSKKSDWSVLYKEVK